MLSTYNDQLGTEGGGLSEVNRAWSDFTTAENDCANAISGLHSDVVFTNPDAATGDGNELVYGESGQFMDLGDGSASDLIGGQVSWQLDGLTEWASEEFHPGDVEFENSSNQAAWDTLVVGFLWGSVQGAVTKSGYWREDTGWASSNQHSKDNLEATWREAAQDAGTLVGIRNEDGWLIDPRSEDPYANLSWGWWWDNATDSAGQIWEGHSAWSQREDDPAYTETYTAINTATLLGGPFKLGAEILDLGGGGTRGGSGAETGTGAENPTESGSYGGPGPGPGAGDSGREIGDIAEEGRTPITERLDEALEQTPLLEPEGPGAPGGPTGPSEPGGPGAPGGPPRQDPPSQGTGTQEGPRQDPTSPGTPPPGSVEGRGDERGGSPSPGPREGDQSPRGDQDREHPGTGDQRDREGNTPPPATGGGSDAPGDGRGSGPQDREGSGGREDTTRPRDEEETPEHPPGRQDEQDQSQQEHQGSRQRERQDKEPSPTPEAETGGGGGHDGGGVPPPTSGGDESGHSGRDDEDRGDGSDDSNNIDPYSITPSDHLPGGNLRASESDGYDGRGHTIERHVDVSDDYLRRRTTGDVPNTGRPTRVAGRFDNLETAERVVAAALHKERDKINEWISGNPPDERLALKGIDVEMGEIGHALRREGSVKNPTGWTLLKPELVNIVLDRDAKLPPGNFRIQTAHPRP